MGKPGKPGKLGKVRRIWRCAVVLALGVGATGCYGYVRRPMLHASSVQQELDGPLRLTTRDGARYDVESAYLLGDSIVGTMTKVPARRVALPLDSLANVERYQVRWKFTALVVGVTAASIASWVLIVIGFVSLLPPPIL